MDSRSEPAIERDALDEKIRWIDAERAAVRPADRPLDRAPGPLPVAPAAGPFAWLGATRTRVILAGVALLVALAAVLGLRMRAGGIPPAPELPPLVSVSAATLAPVTASVSFTGSIRARYEMPIGAEAEAGRVAAIFVEAGDHVAKGQLLARLDTSILRPQVTRLQASLEEAKAEAELASAEYRRAEAVAAAGALSAEEMERRRSTAVTKDAMVKVAAAQLAEAQARLGRTEIRAPEAGLVLARNALIGQTVTPGGDPLFRLARAGEVEMVGQVAEQDLPRLAVGDVARVMLTGIDHPFAGRVRLLGAIIDPQSRLGDVRVALPSDPNLRPGAFARADVAVSQSERPVLPETAVLSDAQGNYVFVIDPTNHVVRRQVQVGGAEGNGIAIASGLNGGERVVTTAAAYLREGELVRVAPG